MKVNLVLCLFIAVMFLVPTSILENAVTSFVENATTIRTDVLNGGWLEERHGIEIVEMAVMPDHLHLIVAIPPTMSISQAFHVLKGASAHELFKRQPKFRLRYPRGHFWSPGKFYRTVGDADVETAINYVRNHNIHQATLGEFCQPTVS